jgi:hypothetical protein
MSWLLCPRYPVDRGFPTVLLDAIYSAKKISMYIPIYGEPVCVEEWRGSMKKWS